MPELAYVNGKITAIEEAVTPVDDRGYQFGDAVYEYVAAYNGRLFCLEEHLDRLANSMRGLDFPELDRDHLRADLTQLYSQSGTGRAGVYIQISRGIAPRNHASPAGLTPQVVMTVRQVREIDPQYRREGAFAITVPDLRWGFCNLKTTQLLPNVMAKHQALARGAQDAIFRSSDDIVREATSSNVFVLNSLRLVTHPLTPNILPGITRMLIIRYAQSMGLTVEERFFDTAELYAADEAFLTGTVTEVLPLVKIDDRPIADGKVGPVSPKLLQALQTDMGV